MTHTQQSSLFVPTRVAAETATVLLVVIRAVVHHRDAVRVNTVPNPGGVGVLFKVQVDPTEKGKIIGKQGRTARSLRVLLSAIAKENGDHFVLDLDGFASSAEDDSLLQAVKPPY